MSKKELGKVRIGSKPIKSKKSERQPLALGGCKKALKSWFEWYFSKVQQFREASLQFRRGIRSIVFPDGTYHPPLVPIPT